MIGAGSHAKVVLDALRATAGTLSIEVRDDDRDKAGFHLLDIEIGVPIGDASTWPELVHIAIGNNQTRCRYAAMAFRAGKVLHTVLHPQAIVSSFTRLGRGVFVAARGVIGPSVVIEDGVIVNHGAIVDHDCRIDAWTHIAPGVVLGGAVHIGKECLIGSGAVVLPCLAVGDGAIVGSGAVVTRNIPPHTTVTGIPARSQVRQ